MPKKEPLKGVIDRSLNYGRHLMDTYLGLANKGSMKVVLDIGAGWGNDLLLARAHNPNAELYGIEIYPEYQEELRQKGMTVHPLNIELERFPFQDESVDVVIANQVLEHIKEIFWVFHESTRVLRVGGSLIIGVPNLASLHNRLLLGFGKQPTCIQNHSAHVRGFTKNDLLKFLGVCFAGGYRLIRFGGSNFYPFPSAIARSLASLLPSMAWGIFLLLEKEREYKNEFTMHPRACQLETNFYLGNE